MVLLIMVIEQLLIAVSNTRHLLNNIITLMQVSSESGWSPNPELLARRQYVRTKWGWFPKEDAFGGGELSLIIKCVCLYFMIR